MMRYLLLPFILFITQSSTLAQREMRLDTLSLNQIEAIDFSEYAIQDYENALIVSKKILGDTSLVDYKRKGSILQAVLANQIELDITNKKFKTTNPELQALLLMFEAEKYYIYRPTMSPFIKLMGYACRGNYLHIYNRYRESRFFLPTVVFGVLFLVFFVLSATRKIKFKYRVLLNRLVITSILLALLLIIIFKQTCVTQLQEYSFYGIPL